MSQYTVIAGNYERPGFIEGQFLDKETSLPTGEKRVYSLRQQDIGIPNYAQAWGQRTYDDGTVPATGSIDLKDPKYHGKIKVLPWGHEKGTLIECRYLKNYRTIDKQYQELVLNAKIDENDPSSADAFFITLKSGENKYDDVTDALLIELLKVSGYNQNSPFKNPDMVNFLFVEKSEETEIRKESKSLDAKAQALVIVANSADSKEKLANLMSVVAKLVVEEPSENGRYAFLQRLADEQPELFMGQVAEHKKYISNIIEKAKSFDVFDLTTDGTIYAGTTKKEAIAEGIPERGEAMLGWVFQNYLDQKANEAIFKLKKITEKLK